MDQHRSRSEGPRHVGPDRPSRPQSGDWPSGAQLSGDRQGATSGYPVNPRFGQSAPTDEYESVPAPHRWSERFGQSPPAGGTGSLRPQPPGADSLSAQEPVTGWDPLNMREPMAGRDPLLAQEPLAGREHLSYPLDGPQRPVKAPIGGEGIYRARRPAVATLGSSWRLGWRYPRRESSSARRSGR